MCIHTHTTNNYKWAIEIARNSIKLDEHIQRFDPQQGRYRKLPVSEWAVIYFVETLELPPTHVAQHNSGQE